MKQILFSFVVLFATKTEAQTDSVKKLSFSGYAEVYYQYDFNKPSNHVRPSFIYSFNRNNEVTLNLGFLKATYIADRLRANFSLMAGTYANANLASEQGFQRSIRHEPVHCIRRLRGKSFTEGIVFPLC